MRKGIMCLFLPVLLLVAACTSAPDQAPEETAAPATTSEARNSVTNTERFEVFVNTRLPGECNDDVTAGGLAGDCWLPAYEDLSYGSRVLNLNDDDSASPCRRVEASEQPDSQKGCWPQPQTTVEVVCDQPLGDKEWRAFIVPKEHLLTEPSEGATYTSEGDVLGWNLRMFLELPEASSEQVPLCSY